MRVFQAVAATTRVDAHGMKFTKGSLERAAAALRGRYIPFLIEHDLLQPIGRISLAEVRQEPDGEWALVQRFEQLEPNDRDVPRDHSLQFKPHPPDGPGIRARLGFEFMHSAESKAAARELAEATGQDMGFEGRRALEPPDLIKITGIFVVGQVASGFLQQLGADGYAKLKQAVQKLFDSRPRAEGSRRLELDLFFEREGVEVILIQAAPTGDGIEAVLSRGLTELDEILPALLDSFPLTRRVVAEYSNVGVRICYIVDADCLPISVQRTSRPAES